MTMRNALASFTTSPNGFSLDYGNSMEFLSFVGSSTALYPAENVTQRPLPIDMKFNEGNILAIVLYSVVMSISAIGNITVFSTILRLIRNGRLTRINLFVLHLNIADLIVTFVMMPLEIAWNRTVSWEAGDGMCRVMSFLRIFGLYLSGFIHVCISIDRYFSVVRPLKNNAAQKRAIILLTVAWVASFVFSLPQSFIFHVETHPEFKWYEQCVTFNSFPSRGMELTYNFFSFFFLYAFPLLMIIICYSRILCEMSRVSTRTRQDINFRSSNLGALGRAKLRTLKMSLVTVLTFFICWTPYNVMSLWYWFDKESAQQVDQRIQKALFLFACTNSCANPLIYGMFQFSPKRQLQGIKILFSRSPYADTQV